MRVIHWFRNDLRLHDNTALATACGRADALLPVFVVDPQLLTRHRSARRRSYLARCIASLSAGVAAAGNRLLITAGHPTQVLPRLVETTGAELVTLNRDYSPYAARRDREVTGAIAKHGAAVTAFKDRVVFESHEIVTQTGNPFRVFTPYRNAWMARWRYAPPALSDTPRLPPTIPLTGIDRCDDTVTGWIRGDNLFAAGEDAARARLDEFLAEAVDAYDENRNLPGIDGTSRLSPALRFGALSIRACVDQVTRRIRARRSGTPTGADKWLDELIWREFYIALLAEHPHVLGGAFRREFDAVEWNDDASGFAAWSEGRTGFPIVDAAMRQLVQTGWMHNRTRMVVASFLVKDLLVDWRKGERFFMEHLIDGDPAANNGGWQWAASTGTDPQPYFRIFNPVAQGKKCDPNGTYVREFVPELRGLSDRYIHCPWESPSPPADYPGPIVDHAERRIAAITRFEAAKRS